MNSFSIGNEKLICAKSGALGVMTIVGSVFGGWFVCGETGCQPRVHQCAVGNTCVLGLSHRAQKSPCSSISKITPVNTITADASAFLASIFIQPERRSTKVGRYFSRFTCNDTPRVSGELPFTNTAPASADGGMRVASFHLVYGQTPQIEMTLPESSTSIFRSSIRTDVKFSVGCGSMSKEYSLER